MIMMELNQASLRLLELFPNATSVLCYPQALSWRLGTFITVTVL